MIFIAKPLPALAQRHTLRRPSAAMSAAHHGLRMLLVLPLARRLPGLRFLLGKRGIFLGFLLDAR